MDLTPNPALSPSANSIYTGIGDFLLRAAERHPKSGLYFLSSDDPKEAIFQSYPTLLDEARRILGGLQTLGRSQGSAVVILVEQARDFVSAFWACVLGGYIPCPLVPIRSDEERWANHLANVDALLGRPVFICADNLRRELGSAVASVDLADLRKTAPCQETKPTNLNDTALAMLTSGSTGNSKAVALTHANLLASMAGKLERENLTDSDVTLNWISFDHVAALLETHMLSLYVGAKQLHADAKSILSDPLLFLRIIDRFRVSMTFSPNFLFGHINTALQSGQNPAVDLSCVRHIVTGGEANVVETCRRFLDLLKPHGLRPDALWPAFGMTETCAGSVYSRDFPQKDIGLEFAAVGVPIKGLEIRVVDDSGTPLQPGNAGELELRGPMIFRHYLNNEEATRAAFTSDGWFRTGDLGVITDGRLSLVGRNKDSIIVSGVNYFSHELEAALERLDGVDRSFVAAFSTRPKGADTEQLIVTFATTFPLTDDERLYQLSVAIRNTTIILWGFRPAAVIPLPKSAFPKTSLGKIQRALMRRRLEAGEYEPQMSRMASLTNHYLGAYVPPEGQLETEFVGVFAEMFRIDPSSVSATASFFDLGGTSLDILKFTRILELRFRMEASVTTVFQYPTARKLAESMSSAVSKVGGGYDPIVALQVAGKRTPLFCIHAGDGGALVFVNLAKYFVNERPFYALRSRGLNRGEQCFRNFDEVVSAYIDAIRRQQPHGPYAIAGYSLGGAIGFEIAKRLVADGEHLAFLGCIDGYPCGEDALQEAAGAAIGAAFLQTVDLRQYPAWARVSHSLHTLGRAHTTSGTVSQMSIFCSSGLPPTVADDNWRGLLKRWDSFVSQPKYLRVAGDHINLMGPKHVATFQDCLRTELNAALQGN